MKKKHKNALFLGLAAVALIAITAGATTYIAKGGLESKPTVTAQNNKKQNVVWDTEPAAGQPRVAAKPVCNDGNIAGKAVGGVAGGVLASNIGKGNGKTAATIGGTLGGAYVGGEYIPLHNVTCR